MVMAVGNTNIHNSFDDNALRISSKCETTPISPQNSPQLFQWLYVSRGTTRHLAENRRPSTVASASSAKTYDSSRHPASTSTARCRPSTQVDPRHTKSFLTESRWPPKRQSLRLAD